MKKVLFIVLGCMIFSASMAQGKVVNDPNAQVRQVKGFNAIKVSTGIHLYLTQGSEEAVAVSASDPEYRDRIKTEVEDGVLKIYYDNLNWKHWDIGNKKLKAYVSIKQINALKASSGAEVDVDGSLKTPSLNLALSSGANFAGAVETQDLKLEQSSGAEAKISGSASNCKVELSSGGSLRAFDLSTNICDASVSSGGSVDITVQKELIASAHSGGEINYKGTALIREIHTGSGGEVSKR